jgi:hypothetical protein
MHDALKYLWSWLAQRRGFDYAYDYDEDIWVLWRNDIHYSGKHSWRNAALHPLFWCAK